MAEFVDFNQFKKKTEESPLKVDEAPEKTVKKITVHYEDGTKRTIHKGFVGETAKDTLNLEFVGTGSQELYKVGRLGLMAFSHMTKQIESKDN